MSARRNHRAALALILAGALLYGGQNPKPPTPPHPPQPVPIHNFRLWWIHYLGRLVPAETPVQVHTPEAAP